MFLYKNVRLRKEEGVFFKYLSNLKKMQAENINQSLVETYFELLKNLSNDTKLEIISKLSQSMKSEKGEGGREAKDLFGGFVTEKSAEELIEEIRNSRVFNRTIEEL